MTNVPVYDNKGNILHSIYIDDNIIYTNDRVCKGEKYYYKGLGTIYNKHYMLKFDDDYNFIKKSNVFYLGYEVSKKCFENKTGIFLEPYQPQFSDLIGTCGVKELSIIENSELFKKSSVEILDSINWDKDNNQYYFHLNYKCNRVKFLQNPQYKDLYSLMEYMIKEGWNFPWDKDSITDISYNGLITDVADIFHSKENKFLLGTLYSILHSLGSRNPELYNIFLKECNLIPHLNIMYYILNSVYLLQKFGVDIKPFSTYSMNLRRDYLHIVKNFLIPGKNCGDCCYVEIGDKIREKYNKQIDDQIQKDFNGDLS